MPRVLRTTLAAAVAAAILPFATSSHADANAGTDAGTAGFSSFGDARGDVKNASLDIRRVEVTNTSEELVVKVRFPGVGKKVAYPLGYVQVYLDTDRSRLGPEYGHFLDFWSDYRFAPTERWREHPTPEWSRDPDGRCVEDAGIIASPDLKLHWMEFHLRKRPGCFDAAEVRVAVTAVNIGVKDPYRPYDRPKVDHLVSRHHWSEWVDQS